MSDSGAVEPAFVPVKIAADPGEAVKVLAPPKLPGTASGVLTLEIGRDFVMRVPGDVPVESVAAMMAPFEGGRDRRGATTNDPDCDAGRRTSAACIRRWL